MPDPSRPLEALTGYFRALAARHAPPGFVLLDVGVGPGPDRTPGVEPQHCVVLAFASPTCPADDPIRLYYVMGPEIAGETDPAAVLDMALRFLSNAGENMPGMLREIEHDLTTLPHPFLELKP